jgi:uncharacterized protein YndB with AHSA1/START domain
MAGPDELTVHIERALPASRSMLFAANTEPRQLAEWWGPKGFVAPSVEFTLRVGGSYPSMKTPSRSKLRATLPRQFHSILSELEECGHFSYLERPDEVERQITAFLTSS